MSILSKKITTVKNSKSFYFSASDFKAAAQPSKKIRSATFEVIDPPKQCANVNEVVEYYRTNLPKFSVDTNAQQFIKNLVDRNICYICGKVIDPSKGGTGPLGSECEHVLSASTIAMLIGLAGNPKDEGKAKRVGDIYFTKVGILFNLLKSNTNHPEKYDELLDEYKKFRGELFPYLYDWAHPACNRLKDNLPFLKIDFTSDGLKISEVSETEANIEFVLQAVLTGIHPSTKKPHSECAEWKKTHVKSLTVKQKEDLAQERLRLVKERAQQIKNKIEATELDKRNLFSLMSTKATLEVVKERTSKYGLFNLMPILMQFFNGAQDKVKNFVEGLNKSADKIVKLKNKFKEVKSTLTTRSRAFVEGRRLRGNIRNVFKGGGWIRGPNGRLVRQEEEIKKEIEEVIEESELFVNLEQEMNVTDDTYQIALTMLGLSQEDTVEEKEDYLSDDIIYGALLLLNLNYSEELEEFFSKYPMATSLEEIFRITPEQILGEEEGGHELDRFREFCEIFRAYMRCNLLPLVDDVGNIITKNVVDSLSLTRVLIDYHWNDWSTADSMIKGGKEILQCAYAKDSTADQLTGYDSIEHELPYIEKEDLALFQLLGDISEKIVDGLNMRSDSAFDEDIHIED